MSLSLITRRLAGLKVAPRATAATVLPQMMGGVKDIKHHQTAKPSIPISLTQPLILQRHFSSPAPSAEENDDGGSVTPLSQMTNRELAEMSTIPGFHLVHNPPRRNTPKGALVGTVVSDKMQKTVNVAVDRYRIVPKYRKRLRFTKKFMAHDEFEVCNMGDLVMIVPCQKISRHKHFMVKEIIRPKGQL